MLVQALTQNVRVRLDGSAAAAGVGFQIKAGDAPVTLPVKPAQVVSFIEETATANLQYQFLHILTREG
jgi:type 1 fimbria pilin